MKHLAKAIFMSAACISCTSINCDKLAELDRMEKNERIWRNQNLKSYVITYKKGCFCPIEEAQKVKVYVWKNEVVDVRGISRKYDHLDSKVISTFMTIDQLFALTRHFIEAGVVELSVEYDADRGYPVIIEGDVSKAQIDNEFTYQVFDVGPYQAPPELGEQYKQLEFN